MNVKWLRLLILPFLLTVIYSKGQLVEYAIPNEYSSQKNTSSRTSQGPLSLPFWDDFYLTEGIPNDSLWVISEDVLINKHYAYLPPSAGVATFDGLRADGSPYNTEPESSEKTDRLTSQPIDISGYTAADNLYLSFFYQFGGYGELPDINDGDKLQLLFKDSAGVWQIQQEITASQSTDPKIFQQVLIKVNNASFFHDDFQFAFQAYGNQGGPFDIWNVDYVYLNKNRSATDIYYPDRTITQQLSNPFKNFTSIPRQHIDLENDLKTPFYLLKNLFNNFQTYRQSVTITLVKENETTVSNYPLTAEGTNSPIFKDEIDSVKVPFPISKDGIIEPDSSVLEIQYKIAVKTFDNRLDSGNYNLKYEPIDFRVNDTIYRSVTLGDYYAYDDGTAEGAAGLQQAGNKVAYKFYLKNVDSAFIHGIDMNTIYAGESPNGKNVEMHIWKDGGNKPGLQLTKEVINIQGDNLRKSFTRYEFRNPVLVQDTFYIGFTLSSSGKLPIGLDKSSNNADKLFEYVNDTWSPVGDRIIGTLMMRPFVGPEPNDPITRVTAPTIREKTDVILYPNPSYDGTFYLKGPVRDVWVTSISGQEIDFKIEKSESTDTKLFIPVKGIYIIKILAEERYFYRKVIIR